MKIEPLFSGNVPYNYDSLAGKALYSFLEANGWGIRPGSNARRLDPELQKLLGKNIPNGTLRIRIGSKFDRFIMEAITDEEKEKRLREEWALPARSQ